MPQGPFRFILSKPQRGAVLILLILLIAVQLYRLLVNFPELSPVDLSQAQSYQTQLDSLRIKENAQTPIVYQYNPNYLTDYRAYTLGLPPEAFDRLLRYRQTNSYVNTPKQFQEVTKLSDSLMEKLLPQLKFSKPLYKSKTKNRIVLKKDINKASASDFQEVSGIGTVLSERIVKYRSYLSGFSVLEQCYEVYGLDSLVVQRLWERFEIQSLPEIERLDITTVSLQELEQIPYLNRADARKIIAYRTKNKGISTVTLSELFVNFPNKLQRIKLYLY
ncbi:helix-hairpin-helix domain-containing protein [Flavobacteriaceae bacterium]|jgi:competence protein ComEA|nr:helix-hairpin-helix domain-containing protein [Flavobacteriaceae bacterium]